VEKAAHRYLLNLWSEEKPSMIGAEHAYPISDAVVVESFIAPTDFWFDESPRDAEHMVSKGDWVICSLIRDKCEFQKVVDGTYTGFSIQGEGKRTRLTEE